jgi:DNA-binding NtrC family response regulator
MRGAHESGRYRVLVVDDDAWMARVIEATLVADMDVVTCPSGELALRMLENEDFHVVCADYKMPGMNGIELLARAARIREHIGCLLVTGADAQLLSEQRKNHYVLTKPFDPARLLGVVTQLARIAEMKRTVEDASARPSTPPSSSRPTAPPPSSRSTVPPQSTSRLSAPSSYRATQPASPPAAAAPSLGDRGRRR